MRLITASMALALMAAGTAAAQSAPRTGQAEQGLQQGKDVYAHWCAPCHAAKPNLAGTSALQVKYEGSVPAALEDRTDLQPAIITYFVRNGVAWMPPFRPTEISDAELESLNAYLTAPIDQRGAQVPLLAEEMSQLQGEAQ